jgi:hypothetical protein
MAIKFNVIAEVLVDDKVVDGFQGLDFEFKDALANFISSNLREKGYGTRIKVYQHNMFDRLNENADDYILRDAQEEIENEILNSKMCVGGSCED